MSPYRGNWYRVPRKEPWGRQSGDKAHLGVLQRCGTEKWGRGVREELAADGFMQAKAARQESCSMGGCRKPLHQPAGEHWQPCSEVFPWNVGARKCRSQRELKWAVTMADFWSLAVSCREQIKFSPYFSFIPYHSQSIWSTADSLCLEAREERETITFRAKRHTQHIHLAG